jgi:hypothetical protein
MAVSATPYGPFVFGQLSGTDERRIDWVNDVIKVALLKPTYVPDRDAQGFWADVSASELSGVTNYVAGGKELSEKTETYDAPSHTTRLKAKFVIWKEVSFEARYAVVYKDNTEPAASPLMGYIDFGEVVKAASGIFKIEWDPTDGVLRGIAS